MPPGSSCVGSGLMLGERVAGLGGQDKLGSRGLPQPLPLT